MLTGKAREDFHKYIQSKGVKFNAKIYSLDLANLIYFAIVTEWLDSVGYYVLFSPSLRTTNRWQYVIYYNGIYDKTETAYNFTTRQEAITSAIKTANEIYNKI